MKDTIKIIMERRSMRGYTSEMPTKEQIKAILDAGLRAPSAMNSQSNHITVITDSGLIKELNDGVVSKMDEDSKARMRERTGSDEISVFYGAPCVMLLSSNFQLESYATMDVGIAVENICIAAEALGLNSCIIGMVAMFLTTPESDAFIAKLNLPEAQKPVIGVALGTGCVDMPTPPINEGRFNLL